MQPTYVIVAWLAIFALIPPQESPIFTPLLAGDSLTGWVVEHPEKGRVMLAEGVLLATHRARLGGFELHELLRQFSIALRDSVVISVNTSLAGAVRLEVRG
jgi:hypothetical protein